MYYIYIYILHIYCIYISHINIYYIYIHILYIYVIYIYYIYIYYEYIYINHIYIYHIYITHIYITYIYYVFIYIYVTYINYYIIDIHGLLEYHSLSSMIFPAIMLHLDVPASRVWLPKGNQVLPKVLKAKDTHSKGSRDQLLHKNLFEENLPRTLFSKQICWENVNCPSMDTGLSGSNAFVCKRLALNRRLTETRPTLRQIVGKYSVQTVTKSSAIPRSKIVCFSSIWILTLETLSQSSHFYPFLGMEGMSLWSSPISYRTHRDVIAPWYHPGRPSCRRSAANSAGLWRNSCHGPAGCHGGRRSFDWSLASRSWE